MLSLSLVSQFLLGPSLLPWVAARPGGLLLRRGGLLSRLLCPGGFLSRLLRCGGLRSRLLRPGGLRSHLLHPGGLRSRVLHPGGLRSRQPRMDLALHPSPGSTSAPPPS